MLNTLRSRFDSDNLVFIDISDRIENVCDTLEDTDVIDDRRPPVVDDESIEEGADEAVDD